MLDIITVSEPPYIHPQLNEELVHMPIYISKRHNSYALDMCVGKFNFMCWRLRSDLPLFRLWMGN